MLLKLLELFDYSNDGKLGFDLDYSVWIMQFCQEGCPTIMICSSSSCCILLCLFLSPSRSGAQPFAFQWSFGASLLNDSSMLGSFSVTSQHHINGPEVFAEEIRDLSIVEDEHSRAALGKQPGKGSRQLVLDRTFNFRFRLIASFLLVLQARARAKEMIGEKHDMRYLFFRP
ncbi:hypothetical protein ACFX13_035351 [Malus domestica]